MQNELQLTPKDPQISEALEANQITGSKADMIEKAFSPMIVMLKGFEAEYDAVMAKEITPVTCMEARALRLKMLKIRTQTAAIHKEQKAEFLRGGKAIDAIKNTLEFAVVEKENKLEEREKHFENLEKQRKQALALSRTEQLSVYGQIDSGLQLWDMSEESFETLLLGTKTAYNNRIEAAIKAEEARIEGERLQKLEQERIKAENERLKAEAEAQKKIEAERIAKEKAERIAKEAAHRAELKAAHDKAMEEQRILAEKAAKEKAEADKKAAELQAQKDAVEAALKAKLAAEEQKKLAEQKAAEDAENAGDKEKFLSLLTDLKLLTIKYKFKTKKYTGLYERVIVLIEKIIADGQGKQ